jgi:RNA polymerase sigma-70 factor, ECF subfamily
VEDALPFDMAAGLSAESHAEISLVVRAQAGDTFAFDELMRTYRERVWSVVYNITGNHADATDLTQEAFIRAFTNISRYNFKSSFYTWLYRIAVNQTLSSLRKRKLKRALAFARFSPDESTEAAIDRMAQRDTEAAPGLRSELQNQLNSALQQLGEGHRTVVVLAEIEGLPLQEVADVLGLSLGTVKSRLHYAKEQLRKTLQPYLNT